MLQKVKKLSKNILLGGFIAISAFTLTNKVMAQEIYVNQLGYYPNAEKYALIENPTQSTDTAYIIDAIKNKIISKAYLNQTQADKFTKSEVSKVDFSNIKQPGKYKIKYNNKESFPFEIGNNVYDKALEVTTKSYYYQTCGKTVNYLVNGVSHPPCHLNDAYIKRSDEYNQIDAKIDATGGWHDAGDYGKYIAPMSVTTYLLMLAYENNPTIASVKMYSTDSCTNMPEILQEIEQALNWMLKMQRQDGAVYRKCSGDNWPPTTTLPQNDTQKRYIFGVSSQDTGRFGAIMAKASRIYKPYTKNQADKYLKAAISAWEFLNTHPYTNNYRSSDDSGSGGYPNPSYDTEKYAYTDIDEKVWIATELYIATKDNKYLTYVKNNIDKLTYKPFSWKNTSIGTYTAILSTEFNNAELKEKVQQKIINEANIILDWMSDNPYSVPLDEIKWGSNGSILNQGVTLTYAYKLTDDKKYKSYAIKTLNYIFGCNPMNKSYVTGLGNNPVKHIHHRFNMSTGIVLPGFLSGGANDTANDNIAKPGYNIKSYIDDERSYATNEYAIDYNAPLVYMLSWITSNKD